MNGVVRALEQAHFAIFDKFPGGFANRRDNAGRDVVFGLYLDRRMKIVAQAEHAPSSVFLKTNTQGIDDQFAAVEFERISLAAVDLVDRVMLSPIVAPFRAGLSCCVCRSSRVSSTTEEIS